ncbi:site-2 protease family protein [Pseudomonas sp. NPDC087697]|uniref:site-2 protease family protein n=1 Tax=Pseudomonas sp. NPDC087697 TaxID=3364447 RepID=UPI003810CEA0
MAELLAGLSILIPALVLAVTVHEATHALTAALFGDRVAVAGGRVSLNPFKHCSLLGTAVVPFSLFILTSLMTLPGMLVGWGKAVPISEHLSSRKAGLLCTALAGPVANLLLAALCIGVRNQVQEYVWLIAFLETCASLNLFLCVVNMLPVMPLDGATCIQALSSERVWNYYKHIQPCLYVTGAGLLFTGLLNKYIVWATQSLLSALLSGVIHG